MSESSRIRFIVWDEFVHAKSWEQYISDYSGLKIDRRRWFGITTGALVIVGSSTWGIWRMWDAAWITPIVLLITGISQVLSASQKHIIVDSETLASLAKLRTMYIIYTDKMERLYLHISKGTLSDEEIEDQYFKIRETVYPIEELKDSLNINSLKKLDKKIEKRVVDFLHKRWGVPPAYPPATWWRRWWRSIKSFISTAP